MDKCDSQDRDEQKVEVQPQLETASSSRNWRGQNSESFFNKLSTEGNWRTDPRDKLFDEGSSHCSKQTPTTNSNWQRSSTNRFNERKTNQRPRPKRHVTFDVAELLAKEPQELIKFLIENLTDFSNFLSPPLPPNTVVQLVLLLEKVCSFETSKFSIAILSRVHNNFMEQLDKYFMKLSLDDEADKPENDLFWNDPEEFWNSTVFVFENIIDRLQKAATLRLDRVIKTCLVTIAFHKNSHGLYIKDSIPKQLGHLKNRLQSLKKIPDQTQNQRDDHYQSIDIYPRSTEVLSRDKPFVRQNIIDGSYMSVEHYLDTHFRLLREDFLAPLRESMCIYKDSLKNNEHVKITEFRVYLNSSFVSESDYFELHHHIDDSYIGNRVRRDSYWMLRPGECTRKYVNTEEVFMPGSLLCFSADNFETMFFGIAAKLRDTPKDFIDVQLLEDIPFLASKTYTMLECSNYFSMYYLVLKALQNFNTYNFPMQKYIVDAVNDAEPPAYLTPTTKLNLGRLEFTALDDKTWPSKEELKLNEMQYKAFKQALTSRCAIIQGPPGTGKTYLGLQIARTLIQSIELKKPSRFAFEDVWSFDDEDYVHNYKMSNLVGSMLSIHRRTEIPSTILVVAYTNHALDQFLEALTPYTENIVRIGHRSKNSKVSALTFSGSKRNGTILAEYYERIQEMICRKEILMDELESVLSYEGIFAVRRFPQLRQSALCTWSNENIKYWLLGNFSTEQARQDRWIMARELENSFETRNTTEEPHSFESSRNYILTVSTLQTYARELEKQLHCKETITMETLFENWDYVEESYSQIQDNIEYLKWRLRNASEHVKLYHTKPIDEGGDLFQLSYNDRWILYFYWLDCYVQYLKEALKSNNSSVRRIWEELEEYKQKEDSEFVRNATVVGMTTSGAAKHRHLIENLNCRIVIVEEAAEVLESHIIVSLTSLCQHLILIGDHQQLRPSTADYQIEKQYQLGISLFERLIRNGIPYSTLGVQHRMRPEISRLIVPSIYENLLDHASVSTFGNIEGIKHNVFFITHPHPEVEIGNSRKNPHEAKYLIALASHLILQGNNPSEITILTTYKGQMYEIMEEQKSSSFLQVKQVQVTVVDNFQGEENQIILLSLVRSNSEGSIGFLRVENRVCVALSRAKKGFYMIGNMNILTSHSSIWPKVNEVLEKNEQIGLGLQLACQLHPQHVTTVIQPEDFLKVPDGGCHLACKADLPCGHFCKRKCHVTDLDHGQYRCMEACTKILCVENHTCPKKCWEKCTPCQVPMERLLPCGHQQMVPCSMKIQTYQCRVLVETELKCGHTAGKPCFADKDAFPCPIEVEAVNPACNHLMKKTCGGQPVDTVKCRAAVVIEMKCGHEIEKECWLSSKMYSCKELCLKTLECGHICVKHCHYVEGKSHATMKCNCQEKCTKLKKDCKSNHICDLPCSVPCKPCQYDVDITMPCGHPKTVPCRKSDRKYRCDRPCRKIKQCGHVCYGKCHLNCDPACFFKVYKKFPNCAHKIKVNCSEDINGKDCRKCLKNKIKKG